MKYKNLFTPFQIGKCELKNRFALAPMGPLGLGDSEGGWNQRACWRSGDISRKCLRPRTISAAI